MRITVGGLLLAGMVGVGIGYYAASPSLNLGGVTGKIQSLVGQGKSLLGFIKVGGSAKDAPPPYVPPPPFPEGLEVPKSADGTTIMTASTQSVIPEVVVSSVPGLQSSVSTIHKAVEEPKSVPVQAPARVISQPAKDDGFVRPQIRKQVKRRAYRAPVAKRISPIIKKPASDPTAGLMGTMVSLELSSGRTVQGVLESKSATDYQLQLPGLGPFSYPIKNVKSIKKAPL